MHGKRRGEHTREESIGRERGGADHDNVVRASAPQDAGGQPQGHEHGTHMHAAAQETPRECGCSIPEADALGARSAAKQAVKWKRTRIALNSNWRPAGRDKPERAAAGTTNNAPVVALCCLKKTSGEDGRKIC